MWIKILVDLGPCPLFFVFVVLFVFFVDMFRCQKLVWLGWFLFERFQKTEFWTNDKPEGRCRFLQESARIWVAAGILNLQVHRPAGCHTLVWILEHERTYKCSLYVSRFWNCIVLMSWREYICPGPDKWLKWQGFSKELYRTREHETARVRPVCLSKLLSYW